MLQQNAAALVSVFTHRLHPSQGGHIEHDFIKWVEETRRLTERQLFKFYQRIDRGKAEAVLMVSIEKKHRYFSKL